MGIFTQKKRIPEIVFNLEKDFEREVFDNYKLLFGSKTILIDAKKKISGNNWSTIPDGFLFDLSDKKEPKFYLIEVELKTHSFLNHIFPQITKFFAFYNNQNQRISLTKKFYEIINSDDEIKSDFKKLIGDQEIFRFLSDLIENNQNILIVIDGDKPEISETCEIYSEWRKMVKCITMRKYSGNGEVIYQLEPELKVLDIIGDEEVTSNTTGENNFLSFFPDIAAQWHPDMNGDKKPEKFTKGSNEIIIWLCPKKHDYPAKIKERTRPNSPTGCPYCSGNKVWVK